MRARLTFTGRIAAFLIVGALLFSFALEDAAPRWLAAIGLAVLVVSWTTAIPFRRLRVAPSHAAILSEGESRQLDLQLASPSWCGLAGLEIELRSSRLRGWGSVAVVPRGFLGPLPLRVRAVRRGIVQEVTLILRSRAPFGLVLFERQEMLEFDALVQPRPRPVREAELFQATGRQQPRNSRPLVGWHGEEEFYAMREYREGDPESRVHPRLTARRMQKVLREMRGEIPPKLHLVLDQRISQRTAMAGAFVFDEAVRFVAGLVQASLRRGVPVALWGITRQGTVLLCPAETAGLSAYLKALAELSYVPGPDVSQAPSLPDPRGPGRRLLVTLNAMDPVRLPATWVAVQVGSPRYRRMTLPRHGVFRAAV